MENFSKIFIKDFKVGASLGIYEGDDKIITPLSASIEVWLNLNDKIKTDTIDETVSYEILADLIRNCTKRHYHILEYLAEYLCDEIFKNPKAVKIHMTLTKTEMFEEGLCGIDWVRTKNPN